jgi:hypothetical protein
MTVDGTWNTSAKTPLGSMKNKLVLKTENNLLSGSITSQFGTDNFSGGKVDGDNFEFTCSSKTPMGPMKIECKGKVEGDKISGLTIVQPIGIKAAFEGTRG